MRGTGGFHTAVEDTDIDHDASPNDSMDSKWRLQSTDGSQLHLLPTGWQQVAGISITKTMPPACISDKSVRIVDHFLKM
jgi:hypothetical protein